MHGKTLRRLLASSWGVPFAVLLALLLSVRSAKLGFFADDYVQALAIQSKESRPLAHLDLYNFASGDAAFYRDGLAEGRLPWWTAPTIRLHFFRPLASALLLLDHRLFGLDPLGYHLHSIVWYLGLVAVVGLLFRRVLPGATGGLALVLFAIDGAHALPVDWIACRHVLVSAVPAVLGVWAHVRYRSEGWRPGRWLGVGCLAVGLLGGETALGGVCYVLAIEAFGPRSEGAGGWKRRARGAAPTLALSVVYLAFYKWLGCGSAGNDFYVEPLSSPGRFALALLTRIPILIGDLLGGIVSDFAAMAPSVGPFVVAGLVTLALVTAFLAGTRRAIPEPERCALQWLVPGAALSLLASVGGLPGSRLLMMSSVGSCPLVAICLRFGLRSLGGAERGRASVAARRVVWGLLLFVHLGVAPLVFLSTTSFIGKMSSRLHDIARSAEIAPSPGQQVFVLGGDALASTYPSSILGLESPESVATWQVLSVAPYPQRITRTGAKSLRVEILGGRFFESTWERLFRSAGAPLEKGYRVAIRLATVVVSATESGSPSAIDVAFERPLDDPGVSLLTWKNRGLRRLVLPQIGESLDLAKEPGPNDGL